MFGFTSYQWTVLLAAWLGLPIGSLQAKQAALYWTGILTSLLLLGWAAGGPFLVGAIAAQGTTAAVSVLFYVGFVPLLGLLFMPWVIETRGRELSD